MAQNSKVTPTKIAPKLAQVGQNRTEIFLISCKKDYFEYFKAINTGF